MLILVDHKLALSTIHELCRAHFGNFFKFVADVERGVIAAGGDMHADAEELLLKNGSQQASLWGANLYPAKSAEKRIEFESFINIRPLDDNHSTTIQSEETRRKIRQLAESLLMAPDEQMELDD